MGQGQPSIRIITGKGGVGKTAVSTALALAEAGRGQRVLLCELNGRDRVAALLGVEPVGYTLREVFDDLTVVDINPRDAIREYVLLTLRFDAIYRAVFENRLVRNFVNLVPSLSELVMLGKIWFHAQERVRGRPRFDTIIVDAPATGHAVALLQAPRVVFETVPAGPMRDNARLLDAMLVDHTQTHLHLVTTPEDMPVTEALELMDAATRLGVHQGVTFINQRLAPLPDGALAALAPLAQDSVLSAAFSALQRREDSRLAGEVELLRLTPRGPCICLPRMPQPLFDAQTLRALAAVLTPHAASEAF